jgi:hypothetical protein
MAAVELNLRPDDRTLRQFGWIALAGFGFAALLAWHEWLVFSFGLGEWRESVAVAFGVLAAYSLAAGLVFPRANLPVWIGLAVVTFPIGFVLSYLIMGLLFFGIITPAGVLLRVVGKDPLERRWLPDASSYWVDARPQRPKSSYFKQF